jgi:hypothetical protein
MVAVTLVKMDAKMIVLVLVGAAREAVRENAWTRVPTARVSPLAWLPVRVIVKELA